MMLNFGLNIDTEQWSSKKLLAFRTLFVYVLFLSLPFDKMLYNYLGQVDWGNINCRDLFIISTYKHFTLIDDIPAESFKWGILGYVNLFLPLLLALIIAFVWSVVDKKRKNYLHLGYWLEVILRYRIGLGMIAWGYRKLMPSQMVLPTHSILNTPFGDLQAQKHYWQSVGIVPGYEVFLGFAEFIPGVLLLFRKTSTIGAALTFVVMVNVALANHAYDGSVHIHSFGYAIMSFILLYPELSKVNSLLFLQKDTYTSNYVPTFNKPFQSLRLFTKTLFLLIFVVWFFVLQVKDYKETPYRLPKTAGLKELNGFYEVSEFTLNGKLLAYNPLDTLRWQDAVFENWTTLAITINKPSLADRSNGGGYSKKDIERKWEVAGIGGGKKWYHYEADTGKRVLYLTNKNNIQCGDKNSLHYKQQYGNKSLENAGEECSDKLVLHYEILKDSSIILKGYNQEKDSLYIKLTKRNIQFPLLEGKTLVSSFKKKYSNDREI